MLLWAALTLSLVCATCTTRAVYNAFRPRKVAQEMVRATLGWRPDGFTNRHLHKRELGRWDAFVDFLSNAGILTDRINRKINRSAVDAASLFTNGCPLPSSDHQAKSKLRPVLIAAAIAAAAVSILLALSLRRSTASSRSPARARACEAGPGVNRNNVSAC